MPKTIRTPVSSGRICLLLLAAGLALNPAASAADWPMFGGAPARDGLSADKNIPHEWDLEAKTNVKWIAPLGSLTYGSPVIAGGKIYIATNNGGQFRPHSTGDKGVLLCLDEKTGALVWQATHDKLASGAVNDWPEQGVASNPCVEGDRVYYVSNRCELVCADAAGFADNENDGPFTAEKYKEKQDADFVWILDMMAELDVFPQQLAACSPTVGGDLVFVCTANGHDDQGNLPKPDAPSFIAVDKKTGRVVWKRNDPGKNILNGQWSSPAYGVVAGQPQAVFGGGDGWCYAFEAETGRPLWKFNLNPPDAVWKSHGGGTKTAIVSTPVIHDDKVYLAVGDDPEAGAGPGHLYCIDATKSGDITETGKIWHYGGEDYGRTISNVAIADGLLYAAELNGYLHCLDLKTGKRHWQADLMAGVWGSPAVVDGKVMIGTTDGELYIFKHDKEMKELALADLGHAIYSTVTAANGALYISTRKRLIAVAAPMGNSDVAAPTGGTGVSPVASNPPPKGGTGVSPVTNTAEGGCATPNAWPMFRGDPQLTGVAPGPLPAKLAVKWKYETPEAVTSTAAIADDTVYVGDDKGILYALNLADGKLKWKYETGEMIESSPAVIEGLVIFGDDLGFIHACDAKTGAARWKYEAGGRVISSPVPHEKNVLVGSYDGALYCLNASDGKLVWKYKIEERVHSTPAVTKSRALFGGCDGKLHVVNLADGACDKRIPLGAVTGASAAVVGSRAYLGTYGEEVLCVDWEKGGVVWRFSDPDRGFPFMSSAAVRDDLVVIGGRDKRVRALNAADGKQRWQFVAKDRIDASPVIVGDRVFIGAGDGVLYALNLADGQELWRYETGSGFSASPAVAAGRLVISSEDGVIYCFGE